MQVSKLYTFDSLIFYRLEASINWLISPQDTYFDQKMKKVILLLEEKRKESM